MQWPPELFLAALAHHLPELRGLEDVIGGAIDEHDAMPGRGATPQLARRNQPTHAAAEDDGAAG